MTGPRLHRPIAIKRAYEPAARGALNRRRAVTFLTASRDLDHSEAAVLAKHVRATAKRRAQVIRPGRADARVGTRSSTRKEARSR